jgi:hypothetical protein
MPVRALIQEWDGTEETVTISTNAELLRKSGPRRPGEGFLVCMTYPDGERQVVEDAYARSITIAEEWPQPQREQPLPWELEARRARVRRALGMRVRYW